MKKSDTKLAKILTYAGTLPLVACVVLSFSPVLGIDNNLFAKTYGAIIISFLCGMHWAIFLYFSEKCSKNLFIISNVIALLAWCSLLGMDQQITYIFQAISFVFLLILDFKLRNAGVLPEWFYHLRRNATVIVVSCLAILALLS